MEENRSIASQTMVVVLAAGKGTRMKNIEMAKVCFEIDSEPAISRIITTCKKQGFDKFLFVVGAKAEDVFEAVGKENPDVMYVYQERQLGTGHAAKIAAEALQNIGYKGNVLVTMGDKFIEEAAINALIGGFIKQQPDMMLLAIPKTKATKRSRGRVFVGEDGQAVDIIEETDLARQAISDELKEGLTKKRVVTATDILNVIGKHISKSCKQVMAVGELLALAKQKKVIDKNKLAKILLSQKYNLEIGGKRFTAKQIERKCKTVNPSLYLFKADAFYRGVAALRRWITIMPQNNTILLILCAILTP